MNRDKESRSPAAVPLDVRRWLCHAGSLPLDPRGYTAGFAGDQNNSIAIALSGGGAAKNQIDLSVSLRLTANQMAKPKVLYYWKASMPYRDNEGNWQLTDDENVVDAISERNPYRWVRHAGDFASAEMLNKYTDWLVAELDAAGFTQKGERKKKQG